MPTVIVTPTPELAQHLHMKLRKYLGDERPDVLEELLEPRLFTATVDPAICGVFEGIHKGAVTDTRVIVTSYDQAIGVNFWPRCFVCSTHQP